MGVRRPCPVVSEVHNPVRLQGQYEAAETGLHTIAVQDPRGSVFIYNPKWQELQIVIGVSLVLNKKAM